MYLFFNFSLNFNASSILLNCNHKQLGLYYLWFALIFGILGITLSLVIRTELYTSGSRLIAQDNQNFYNIIISAHGIIMIFFNIQPALFGGFGNYFLPVLCGSPEVAYPRINSLSLFLQPVAYCFLLSSIVIENGYGPGWTVYPPLSVTSANVGADLVIIGLILSGLSSLLGSVNFLTTVCYLKANGLTTGAIPFNVWGIVFTSLMLLATLPILTGGLIMLISDIHFNTSFFDPIGGGDPVLYQHLFWFFGHPEVYVLILPAFGIISQVISLSCSRPVFGYTSMVLAMGCISVLGCLVWAHHMMVVGLEADTRAYFTAVTMLISVPTGTKVFNWLCTYVGNNMYVNTSAMFLALIFIVLFTLGGTTGVMMGNAGIDVSLHDTYYIVAHFHFVLSLGAITGILCGVLFAQEHFFGFNLRSNSICIFYIGLFIVGVLLTFVPMHLLGFGVMPRRMSDYCDSLNAWNILCTLGVWVVILGTVLFFYQL